MMELTPEEVRKVADLARLELSDEEVEQYRRQLSEILAYVAQLNELDLDEVEPTPRAVAQANVWREDEARHSLPLQEALYNAAKTADAQFLIQAVFADD